MKNKFAVSRFEEESPAATELSRFEGVDLKFFAESKGRFETAEAPGVVEDNNM